MQGFYTADDKFTFRKDKKLTGLAAIAEPWPRTIIKIKSMAVGYISPPSRFGGDNWSVHLRVVDNLSRAGWRSVSFARKFDHEAEARRWLVEKRTSILSQHRLFGYEDDKE